MDRSKKWLVKLSWTALILYFIIYCGFFTIQIVKSDYFQKKVVEQRVKESEIKPRRGMITDRNGNYLALPKSTADIEIFPEFLDKREEQVQFSYVLSKYLDRSFYDILKKVETDKKYLKLENRVDPEKVEGIKKELKERDLNGIRFVSSPSRFYPNGSLAAGILGFTDFENKPQAGIEYRFDQYLAGVPGYQIGETYLNEKNIPIGFTNKSNARNGQTVTLTIDSYMQMILENRLQEAMEDEKMAPKGVHGIVMNPKTGEIYAMASYPTFDPNHYSDYKPSTWTNNPASYVYEPGSTFKPVYMAMALEQGFIKEDDIFTDNKGFINLYNEKIINNWDNVGHGEMTLEDIIINSSNVGMVKISQKLTIADTIKQLSHIGFGKRTGIELPGEEVGLFPTKEGLQNDLVKKATISFGQGISITPLQLITTFSEVINGGFDLDPYLVKEVIDENNNPQYFADRKDGEKHYSVETVNAVKTFLKANMEKGSGENVQLSVDSGGKTGSAWVVEKGLYKKGSIVGSFIGFAPYEDPELATLIVVDQPKGEGWYGSTTAGPIYKDVVDELLRYMKIKSDETDEEEKIDVPFVKWQLFDEAKQELENSLSNIRVVKEGDSSIVVDQQYFYKHNKLYIKLLTKDVIDENSLFIVDFYGKSKEEIEKIIGDASVNYKIRGSGYAVEQNLKPGKYQKNERLEIWLK